MSFGSPKTLWRCNIESVEYPFKIINNFNVDRTVPSFPGNIDYTWVMFVKSQRFWWKYFVGKKTVLVLTIVIETLNPVSPGVSYLIHEF